MSGSLEILLIGAIVLYFFLCVQTGFIVARKIIYCRMASILSLYVNALESGESPVVGLKTLVSRFTKIADDDRFWVSDMYKHHKEHKDDHS